MVVQRLTQITPPAATPDQLWQCVEAAWSAVPQEHIQSLFESMPRHVAAASINIIETEKKTHMATLIFIAAMTQVTPNPHDRAGNEIPSPTGNINVV
ncbi:hypothetical protein TNCV_1282901 [Trichonephila clavipes]|uniref:Uncharacterized protein n=1 Tax=Trichonephila clavipes TaxID=2585209 RepID=A0A8X6SUN8_TRICX|nr:hypothetical protein TNCV_1282901 [Trichonephila clavipes]